MEIDNMVTVVSAVGIPCFLILVIVAGIWKAAPNILKAYREGNQEIVGAIKEVAVGLTTRLDKLENKVDELDDKVDNIIRKE